MNQQQVWRSEHSSGNGNRTELANIVLLVCFPAALLIKESAVFVCVCLRVCMQNYVKQNGLFRERFSYIKSTLFKPRLSTLNFFMYGKYVHTEQQISLIMPDQLQLYLKTTQLKKTKAKPPQNLVFDFLGHKWNSKTGKEEEISSMTHLFHSCPLQVSCPW